MDNFLKGLGAVVLGVLLVVIIATLMAFPIKWAWNEAVVPVFHLSEIGALQAWCFMFLGSSFFKSSVSLKCKHDD